LKKWWIEEFFFWLEPMGDRKWRRQDILWVPVDTHGLTKWARGPALIFAAYYAVLWFIHVIFNFSAPGRFGLWALMYACIWGIVTWGLLKMRPEAAMGGLALTIWALLSEIMQMKYWECLRSIVIAWAFVHAIRGTFAYKRFPKQEPILESGQDE
jgi:hypothetical protein